MSGYLHIFVNGIWFDQRAGVKELMTGRELAALAGFPAATVEIHLEPAIGAEHLRVETFRPVEPGDERMHASVRATHLPTGLTITCHDGKTQIENRAEAMRILRARLYESGQIQQRAIKTDEELKIKNGDQFFVRSV